MRRSFGDDGRDGDHGGKRANDNGDDRLDTAAAVLEGFEGVRLDAQAEAAIAAALEACAEPFVRLPDRGDPYRGALEPPVLFDAFVPFAEGEAHWSQAGAAIPAEWAEAMRKLEAANRDAPEPAEAKPVSGDGGGGEARGARLKAGRRRRS